MGSLRELQLIVDLNVPSDSIYEAATDVFNNFSGSLFGGTPNGQRASLHRIGGYRGVTWYSAYKGRKLRIPTIEVLCPCSLVR